MADLTLLALTFLVFCTSFCRCQRDCTGVDCPPLDNCIEEVLESGDCCASCLQKGCTCEGYQYYDCLNAGFKNGKVGEGKSYFVDYGSTECSCPLGGGRISCDFISCPEMPANCIEVSAPEDGCVECVRVGCVHEDQKFDAGHSFHMDPCQVCHCPNTGGELMCYLAPDCDSNKFLKPFIAASTDPERYPDPLGYLPPIGNLPLFKAPPLDKETPADYEYEIFEKGIPETFIGIPYDSTQTPSSSVSNGVISVTRDSDQSKLELRDRQGFRHPEKSSEFGQEVTEQSTISPPQDATTSWQLSQGFTSAESAAFGDLTTQPDFQTLLHTLKSLDGAIVLPNYPQTGLDGVDLHQSSSESETGPQIASADGETSSQFNVSHHETNHRQSETENFPPFLPKKPQNPIQAGSNDQELTLTVAPTSEEEVEEEEEEEVEIFDSVTEPGSRGFPFQTEPGEPETTSHVESSSDVTTTPEATTTTTSTPRSPENPTSPTVPYLTTTQHASGVELGEAEPSRVPFNQELEEEEEREEQTDVPVTPGPGVSLLQSCCVAGQKWASENQHCKDMRMNDDSYSICSVVGQQCCLSSVKQMQCDSGLSSARGGHSCLVEEEEGGRCTDDSYQVCCSCCALGLRVRAEGGGCDAHSYLSYPCGHVFLTCCEEEEEEEEKGDGEEEEEGRSQTLLRRKQKPKPTTEPREVSDRKFPKESFSVPDESNAVETPKEVDECRLYAGTLCQHICTNIWGSYRCDCHQGYILQPDGHSCAPVSPDEDNGVSENSLDPTQSPTSRTITSSTVHLDPCAGNGGCSQQCSAVGRLALCSCFPGFSLMTDGRTCQDVDECSGLTHGCQAGERCVNTVGSFVCELQVRCAAGYRLRNGRCEDVDECLQRTHSCGPGSECENTLGSFLCKTKTKLHKCITGFTEDSHGNCIDINECSSLPGPCSSGLICINTVGSFSCQQKTKMCGHGYRLSAPDQCVDIDECQMGTHRCGPGQICHNLVGNFRCDCPTGYQWDASRKNCIDVNECWRFSSRLCAQKCENTLGSYRCSCSTGFKLAPDGKNCEDINECERSPCSQECANTYSSYQCYCRQGYHLKEDGHTCEDIDECSQVLGNLCTFQCVNVAGSYQCACPPNGYVMAANGRTCKDIDECTAGTHNCSYGQTCFNLQGGFRCLSFDCPHNYKKTSDTRCERTSCPSNSVDCHNSPVQITYHQLSFQTNIIVPAQIFRIAPSPAYSGDHIVIGIVRGNAEGYFSTRKLNGYTGAVYLQRQVRTPRDFLIDVEMKLLRRGKFTSFLSRIYVFITASSM